MTDFGPLYHVGITSVLRRYFLSMLLVAAGSSVQAGVSDQLSGYVAGCEAALLDGDIAAYADLELETETETETVEVFGWRGGDVVVSLLVRIGDEKRSGVCDVSYRPIEPTPSALNELALLSEHMTVTAMIGPHKIENAQSGPVILTCSGNRGMALFLDPAAEGSGFAAQVATVPPHRMKCEG